MRKAAGRYKGVYLSGSRWGVKVYKPYRKTDAYKALEPELQLAEENPDRLILDHIIPPSALIERGDMTINKISLSPRDKQLNSWRNMDKRPLVKCLCCGKETINLAADPATKMFCSTTCGTAYRYFGKKEKVAFMGTLLQLFKKLITEKEKQ